MLRKIQKGLPMITNSEIAKMLEEEALSLPDFSAHGAEKFEKKFGSFTVRCRPTRSAVMAMAKKFQKRTRFTTNHTLAGHSDRRNYSSNIYDQFVRDGETHNAITYNQLIDKPVYFASRRGNPPNLLIINAKEVEEGFIVGRVATEVWNVYHIDTGMTCGCASSDRAGAVLHFEGIKKEDLIQATENNKCRSGFQQRALDDARL